MVTVKALSIMAGVSVRTLHHYDHLNLLKPSRVGDNGYRYYDGQALLRLQQILFFRDLGLSLKEIAAFLDAPDFELRSALRSHRAALEAKRARLGELINTVDSTIASLQGEWVMDDKKLFKGFDAGEERRYAQEARERWGAAEVDASYGRWNSYSAAEQAAIKKEGQDIYSGLAQVIDLGPHSAEAQALISRWHEHLRHFYQPTVERLRGLGELYAGDPAFADNFRELHAGLPEFMREAIAFYCDQLDGAAIGAAGS